MIRAVPVITSGPGRGLIVYDTPLDRYLRVHDVKPTHLAAEAGIARQALSLYRAAVQEPTRAVMARIVVGLRAITGKRVRASELWYLGEVEQDAWKERYRTIRPATPQYYYGREPKNRTK